MLLKLALNPFFYDTSMLSGLVRIAYILHLLLQKMKYAKMGENTLKNSINQKTTSDYLIWLVSSLSVSMVTIYSR
jgi:hypothetical protein